MGPFREEKNTVARAQTGKRKGKTRREKDALTKRIIEAGLQDLAEQVADPNHGDEVFDAYLSKVSRFHQYSFGNTCLLEWQWLMRQSEDPDLPDISRVAGHGRWKSLGRHVKRGEKGLLIRTPQRYKIKKKDEETGEEEVTGSGLYFGYNYVFDVSQTDGEDLGNFKQDLGEDAGAHTPALVIYAEGEGIEVVFRPGGLGNGQSFPGKIRIDSALPVGIQVQTTIHEIAHELLHQRSQEKNAAPISRERSIKEGEAEAVAVVVMRALGFDVTSSGASYIRSHKCSPEGLRNSFNRIVGTARPIIEHLLGDNAAGTE